jgi:hypothetical protein
VNWACKLAGKRGIDPASGFFEISGKGECFSSYCNAVLQPGVRCTDPVVKSAACRLWFYRLLPSDHTKVWRNVRLPRRGTKWRVWRSFRIFAVWRAHLRRCFATAKEDSRGILMIVADRAIPTDGLVA